MDIVNSPYIELEEQHQAAGWHATCLVLAEYGRSIEEHPESRTKAIGKHTLELCHYAYKQPHEFVPHIQRAISNKNSGAISEYRTTFTDISGVNIATPLQMMHMLLYEDDAIAVDARNESNFARLHDDTVRCATFYENTIQNHVDSRFALTIAVKSIQFNSAFYIGLYDTETST